MNNQIAIIDDESDILELVSLSLKKYGFTTKEFLNFELFSEFYATNPEPILLVLDLMLPGYDGYEICKILRKSEKFASLPIIMLTAKAEEIDKVLGLELGADDYMTKPFSPKELAARVKALLRRSGLYSLADNTASSKIIKIKDILMINPERFEVFVFDQKVDLTTTEFKLLELFCTNIGIVYSRNRILDYLWGNEKAVFDRTVDVHVKNLRDKIGEARKYIKNIRGLGYKFEI